MFTVLNAYLFQHKSISIPGLGTIHLETEPAQVDVVERTMLPPVYQFRFDKYFDAPDREFFSYIAAQRDILDYEAIKWYNEFSLDLRNRIKSEEEVSWDGVGILRKDGGEIAFEPAPSPLYLQPVPAIRVNRQNAEHTILVGDQERTNTQMNELLQDEGYGKRKIKWWVAAIIIASVALALLGWHFFEHGWSIGNQNKF